LRVFVVKAFRRFQRKERISDEALCEAIGRAEQGLIDADLGGGLIKQRVARQGQGRSGGYRTIIAYREGDRSVFLFGFAKSGQDNISEADRRDLTDFGAMWLAAGDADIDSAISENKIWELECE
jgi:hypothetical protein